MSTEAQTALQLLIRRASVLLQEKDSVTTGDGNSHGCQGHYRITGQLLPNTPDMAAVCVYVCKCVCVREFVCVFELCCFHMNCFNFLQINH